MAGLGTTKVLAQADGYDFEFGDLPDIVPEQTLVGLNSNAYVSAESRDYIVVSKRRNDPECFNYAPQTTREITVIGKTVVIQPGHDNGLYEAYFLPDVDDLRSFDIYAQTVVIRAPMRVAGGDVTIYAQSLRFEDVPGLDPAQIITTPYTTNRGIGDCTTEGQPAGSLTLHVQELDVGAQGVVRFDLGGADGWQVQDSSGPVPVFGKPGNGGDISSTVDVTGLVVNEGGLPAAGSGSSKEVTVILPGTPFWLVPWTGGDREYKGHGPVVNVTVDLEKRNSNELWTRITFDATEDRADWTRASGVMEYHRHTHGKEILDIVSDKQTTLLYTDHTDLTP